MSRNQQSRSQTLCISYYTCSGSRQTLGECVMNKTEMLSYARQEDWDSYIGLRGGKCWQGARVPSQSHQKVNVTVVDLDLIAKQIWGLTAFLIQEESIYKAFYLVLFLNINFFSYCRVLDFIAIGILKIDPSMKKNADIFNQNCFYN